jgi:FixJ family two-component response regulator
LRTLARTYELAVRSKPRLIAIVDDDESVREATKALIQSIGLAAEAFPSAVDFLRSPQLGRITCLVTDLNMPGMNGFELHHRIAAVPESIPTILITAYPSDSLREHALSAGIVGFLVKPFSEDELLNCIGDALGPGALGH